jgi:hypothetical protein
MLKMVQRKVNTERQVLLFSDAVDAVAVDAVAFAKSNCLTYLQSLFGGLGIK